LEEAGGVRPRRPPYIAGALALRPRIASLDDALIRRVEALGRKAPLPLRNSDRGSAIPVPPGKASLLSSFRRRPGQISAMGTGLRECNPIGLPKKRLQQIEGFSEFG